MTPAALLPYALVPLILWRVYARVKRLTTRQQSGPRRHWASLLIFPPILAGMGVGALAFGQPWWVLGVLALGLAAGVGLGVAGLQRTRFEQVGEHLFYTPNAHIGIFVSLLVVGRVCMRMIDMFTANAAQDHHAAFGPATMIVLGIMGGYYMMYSAGLLRYRHAHGIK